MQILQRITDSQAAVAAAQAALEASNAQLAAEQAELVAAQSQFDALTAIEALLPALPSDMQAELSALIAKDRAAI